MDDDDGSGGLDGGEVGAGGDEWKGGVREDGGGKKSCHFPTPH